MSAPRRDRRFARRRRVAALLVLGVALFAGYHFWLRDSSLFAIDEVTVEGATTAEDQIEQSLVAASASMTTLHVDDAKLAEAVAGIPTVASIKADASIPSKLTVTVTERLPVAVVKVSGEPTAVAADGLLLPGISVSGQRLPTLDVGEVEGGRVDDEGAAQAAIVGAAPDELRERVEAIAWDPERGGVVVALEGAPELRFGDGSEADEKWQAAATVLLDPELGSPAYVDVSVPERTVSGG